MQKSKGDKLKDLIIMARQVQFQYQLAGYTDVAIKELMKIVDQARVELLFELDTRSVLQLEQLNDLTFGGQQIITGSITEAAAIANETAYKEYGSIMSFDGKLDETVGFSHVLPSAAQIRATIVDIPLEGHILSEWIAGTFDVALVQELKTEFGAGLLRGESLRKLAARVPKSFGLIKDDITTLTRTYIADANNRAAKDTYDANSDIVTHEKWDATLEVGMSGGGTCLRCAGLDNVIFPLDEPHVRPPLHFRCRCYMLPITKSYRELGLNIDELEKTARPYTERLPGEIGLGRFGTITKAGMIKDDFEGFLKSRDNKYQLDLLGPNRLRLMQEGKIKFQDMVDKNGNIVLLKKNKEGEYIGLQK